MSSSTCSAVHDATAIGSDQSDLGTTDPRRVQGATVQILVALVTAIAVGLAAIQVTQLVLALMAPLTLIAYRDRLHRK